VEFIPILVASPIFRNGFSRHRQRIILAVIVTHE